MDFSDHCPLYLPLTTTYRQKLTLWRLNSSILNGHRIEQFAKEISDYLEYNDNGEVSLPVVWDACKAVMRGKVIAVTSLLKKQRMEKLNCLQVELEKLESKHKDSIDPRIKLEMTSKRNQRN